MTHHPIKFRPHHFLCTLGFQGAGYSPKFIQNFQSIVDQLNDDPNTSIQVVEHLDSICSPCPNQTLDSQCQKQSLITHLDENHAEVLGLREGDVITWAEAKQKIKKHMTLEKFHTACDKCGWKKTGVCEKALKNL